jgi:hypothetical protein
MPFPAETMHAKMIADKLRNTERKESFYGLSASVND